MNSVAERIDVAIAHSTLKTRNDLADSLGISRQYLSQAINGKSPAYDLWPRIAEKLSVSVDWLKSGRGPLPQWVGVKGVSATSTRPLDVVGVVTAGDGDLTRYEELPAPTPWQIPSSWKIVQVFGKSAYPVIYEGQWAAIDTNRAQRPPFSSQAHIDLHDNIVLVQTDDGRGFLKRFCHAPGAPGDFILASIDGGKSSPFVRPESIIVVAPVVGTFFVDPGQPRSKRWHNKTVTVDHVGERP